MPLGSNPLTRPSAMLGSPPLPFTHNPMQARLFTRHAATWSVAGAATSYAANVFGPHRVHAGGVHKAEGDLWLSPETRLLADAPGCDSFEYNGTGHRLVRLPRSRTQNSCAPGKSCSACRLHVCPTQGLSWCQARACRRGWRSH